MQLIQARVVSQFVRFSHWRHWIAVMSLCGGVISASVGAFAARYQLPSQYLSVARILASEGTWRYPREATEHGRPAADLYAYRPPGFPAALAAAYRIFGQGDLAALILQSTLVALIIAAISLIGRELFGPSAGIASGVATLFFPYLLFHYQTVIDTTLYSSCLLWMLYGALVLRNSPGVRTAALVGLTGCCAVLTRPTAMVIVILVVVWAILIRVPLRALLTLSLFFMAPLLAWLAHLYFRLGAFTFVATNGGWNLWLSNNSSSLAFLRSDKGSLDPIEFSGEHSFEFVSGLQEADEQDAFTRAAGAWIADHPFDLFRLLLYKAYLTLLPILRPRESTAKTVTFFVTALPIYLGTLVAMVKWRRCGDITLIGTTIALSMLLNIVFLPYARILAPIFPLMICLTVGLFFAVGRERAGSRVAIQGRA